MELQQYPQLRESQRLAARNQARKNLLISVGKPPEFKRFQREQISRYSPGVYRALNIGIWVTLICAFIVSGVHIFSSAKESYGAGITDPTIQIIAGFCFVILAELAALVFSSVSGLFDMPKRLIWLLNIFAGVSAVIAIVGNVSASIQFRGNPFDWILEWFRLVAYDPMLFMICTVPPLFVLGLGAIEKHVVLSSNRDRWEANANYQKALKDWQDRTADNNSNPDWLNSYAKALWESWKSKNPEYRQIDNTLRDQIVWREIDADEFFSNSGEYSVNMNNRNIHKNLNNGNIQNTRASAKSRVLAHLREYPEDIERDQNELAELLNVSQPTISRAIQALSKNGYHN